MQAFLEFWKDFPLVFLPLFVAMDALGVLPFLVSFLGPMPTKERGSVVRLAVLTGLMVGLVFLGLGKSIFLVLGISVSDFLVAGGIVLLALALKDLLSATSEAPVAPNELTAVVPIGTPLLVGPATISMLILLSGLFSLRLVVLAFLANVVVAWAIFAQSRRIAGFLGAGGLRAVSKVTFLLLAAIAVQLVRRGIIDIMQEIGQTSG
jgi:multiple antibiotic resistance protein